MTPDAQKSKERLSFPTQRKDTEEAKARETTQRGNERFTDIRPACWAKATEHGRVTPAEL